MRDLPKFFLSGLRSVSVPDFQAVALFPKILLGNDQPPGHSRAHESWRAGRIERTMRDVIGPGVTQIDHDRLVDTLDIDEVARLQSFSEREIRAEERVQNNDPEDLSETHA